MKCMAPYFFPRTNVRAASEGVRNRHDGMTHRAWSTNEFNSFDESMAHNGTYFKSAVLSNVAPAVHAEVALDAARAVAATTRSSILAIEIHVDDRIQVRDGSVLRCFVH